MRAIRAFLVLSAAALVFTFAQLSQNSKAQQPPPPDSNSICTRSDVINPPASGSCIPVSAANPLPVSASVSASISGFTAASTGTPISVTTGGVTGTLPAGAVVVATNVGTTNAAYCALGASATTSSQYISPNGGWFAFTVLANTQLTCITSTSTTTVNMTGGAGLPTGTGGGSGSGGGGGGAVTIADGADVAQGALADTACASDNGTCSELALLKRNNQRLTSLLTAVGTPFQAGGSIGNTAFAVNTWASGTLGAMAAYGTSPGAVLVPGVNAFITNTNANGSATGANSSPVVIASDQTFSDPCMARAKSSVAISQATSTVLVSASASNRIYVCSLTIIAGAAEIIAITQGTGSVCGTSADPIIGSTTVGNGLSLAANGGLTLGNGGGTVARGPNTNEDVCLLQDGSDRLAGVMTYVLAP